MTIKSPILIIILFFVLIISCQSENKETNNNNENTEYKLPKRQVDLQYFETEVGWGYKVKINGKNYITQKHLPCDCGGKGFKTKEQAVLAAEFLKKKIVNNERSLQINRMQLDSLGAL